MLILPEGTEARLTDVPEHACEPVQHALAYVHNEVRVELGGPSLDLETDAGIRTYAANEIARLCGKLCADGCANDERNRMENLGLDMPHSQEREDLHRMVSGVLIIGAMFSEQEEEPDAGFITVELTTSGDDLKEIIGKRIDFLQNPELLESLASNSEFDIAPEELGELFEEIVVPIKDDEAWDKFALLVNGNVRAALSIYSHMQEVHRVFMSDEPRDARRAESITEGEHLKDDGWEQKWPGFTPEELGVVTANDFYNLAALIGDNGGMNLWDGSGGKYVKLTISDEVQRWRDELGVKVSTTRNGVEIED